MTYKQVYNKMHKKAAGQLAGVLASGAGVLAAIGIALAGGTGVATGYFQNFLTRPRKQDKQLLSIQHRNNRLRQDIQNSKLALQRLDANSKIEEANKKPMRVF